MADITLTWDSSELSIWRGEKMEAAIVRALSKSGGDAIRFMRTGSSRLVRSRKRFSAARVSRALPIFFPTRKQRISELVWRMNVGGKPVPLIDFPHGQTRRGVTIAVNAGKRTLLQGAFLAKMKSGHEGIFLRALSNQLGPVTKSQAKRGMTRRRVGRLPIEEAFSTRVSDVFQDADFIPFIQAGTQEKFSQSFDRLLPLELGKLARR